MAEPTSSVAAPSLTIERTFNAPRDLVWKAWTEPEHVRQWLGPGGFTATDFQMDPAPGGAWSSRMVGPDGGKYANRGVIREVIEPERLVFTFAWDDENGEPGREMLITITLTEEGGRTQMTFHQAEFESAEDRDGHEQGWSESFDKLAAFLSERKIS